MASYLPDAVPPAGIRRALVTKLRHHGDVLLATPVFTALKRAAPHAAIDALVYLETAPLLAGHPAIDVVHAIDRNREGRGALHRLAAEWRLLHALRERRYDLIVHLTEHPRGLVLATLLHPHWAVTRERAASDGALRRRIWRLGFTHFYRQPKATPRHTVESNLDALRRIGIYPDLADRRLVLHPGAAATAAAGEVLAANGAPADGFVHVHPGSRWRFKCWPAASTAALVVRIVDRGLRVVLTGAPDETERALAADILARIPAASRAAVADLTGRLSLPELAVVASRARLFVGVDSAPMHIAAAMGTPVVALFGPSGENEWGPWQVAHRVVASRVHPCRPCGIDGCGGGKVSDCLASLAVDAVAEACDALLADPAVHLTARPPA
ncbi:MAG: putative lipopolysaccharide heptosyltransferase III [Proteobacteria bacterium]|nr:putative lipopolysaccharide heptosyltransferase III [Pseudomonadota bacterium]